MALTSRTLDAHPLRRSKPLHSQRRHIQPRQATSLLLRRGSEARRRARDVIWSCWKAGRGHDAWAAWAAGTKVLWRRLAVAW